MDAVILAGGLGTRLQQAVPHLPKTLAPIQGVPFLQLLLEQLAKSGCVDRAVFALGYKAVQVEEFLKRCAFPVAISKEETPLGTGGALLQALDVCKGETLLVMNGDSYFDLDLAGFVAAHRENGADVTIACRQMEDTGRYGTIEMEQERIVSFREKTNEAKAGWINGGIYLIEKKVLNFPKGVWSLEKDFFPRFLEKKIFGYPQAGGFIDIGTPVSYSDAQTYLQPWICQ